MKNSINALKESYEQKKKVGGWDYKLVLGFLFYNIDAGINVRRFLRVKLCDPKFLI